MSNAISGDTASIYFCAARVLDLTSPARRPARRCRLSLLAKLIAFGFVLGRALFVARALPLFGRVVWAGRAAGRAARW
jgi:hypothetical protein